METFGFIPNVIGYIRAACLIASAFFFDNALYFHIAYSTNFVLDGVDGFSARYFNQVSRFGYCLDMILDRLGSALLFAKLTHVCYKPLWMILMFLDLSSHWFMTLSTQEHKQQRNAWIQVYYSYLGIVCAGNEIFLINIAFAQNPYIFVLCLPVFLFKQYINVLQLGISSIELVNYKNYKF
jgi:CDP-diacylglycerol--inositol 3-phosphatidyltransferase